MVASRRPCLLVCQQRCSRCAFDAQRSGALLPPGFLSATPLCTVKPLGVWKEDWINKWLSWQRSRTKRKTISHRQCQEPWRTVPIPAAPGPSPFPGEFVLPQTWKSERKWMCHPEETAWERAELVVWILKLHRENSFNRKSIRAWLYTYFVNSYFCFLSKRTFCLPCSERIMAVLYNLDSMWIIILYE